jgi:hypothetical protein
MESGNKYRKLAQDCLRLSVSAGTAEDRAILIDMAQAWLRLADSTPKLEHMVDAALIEAKEAIRRQASG